MRVSVKAREQLRSNPARFIRQQIKDFMRTSPTNRLSLADNHVMWDEPQLKFADADDPIFTEYKSVVAPTHLTPREALAEAYHQKPEDMPTSLSVISWILPIVEVTRRSNRAETRVPSRLWSHTRWYGEKANEKLRAYLVELLKDMGYLAVAPILQPYFMAVKVYSTTKTSFFIYLFSGESRHISARITGRSLRLRQFVTGLRALL